MDNILQKDKFDNFVEDAKEKTTLSFEELSKQVKKAVFKSKNWEIEKELLQSSHQVQIKKLEFELAEKQRVIDKQAKQLQSFKTDIKNIQSKTYQDLINDENDKLFIKFVGEYKIQADDKVHFIRKIDEMVVEIDKCIEMLQSK